MIDVVSAVIVRGDRILLTQRRSDKDFPWQWESPGGKVEDGETHNEALMRELHEEVGATVIEARNVLWDGIFEHTMMRGDRKRITLYFYDVRVIGELSPQEGQGFGWFLASEMRTLHLAPANARALTCIADLMLAGAFQ